MSSHKPVRDIRSWIDRGFTIAEDSIYAVLGLLLAIAAVAFLIVSAVDFFSNITGGKLTDHIVTLLGQLLLVLLIVELLYTVKVSLIAGKIVIEPFLLIGLIAAIRRIFVLTAEFSDTSGTSAIQFKHHIIELGALSVLILVIAISLVLLRKSARYEDDRSGHVDG